MLNYQDCLRLIEFGWAETKKYTAINYMNQLQTKQKARQEQCGLFEYVVVSCASGNLVALVHLGPGLVEGRHRRRLVGGHFHWGG